MLYTIPEDTGSLAPAYDRMRSGLYGVYQSLLGDTGIYEGAIGNANDTQNYMSNLFHKAFPSTCPETIPPLIKQ